ncbi:PIH1 domain-containing protein 1 isoform X3 [Phyllopteryx taeniolatus]|nr:PIH1 domain-containing protein 1 isoform X3 [Phyllopteryx taeniolatus]XP_061606325.1 PIH1 domain-containing protein 1 isoform X3 [Phyllopteryx taeniolatus]
MTTDSTLLNSEMELEQQEDLYQQLLSQTLGNMQTANPDSKVIRPQPGICVKTTSERGKQKVFVNICQSNMLPSPPEISREKLLDLLQSEDPSGYRVPMSLGEPHIEVDNNSQGCTAYDVVINQEFFQKCQKEPLFQQFVIMVSLEGLENKYNMELSREWKVLKNRKFLGSVSEQNIRTKSKPVIQELRPRDISTSEAKRPELTLYVEPPSGVAQYLIAEIKLPGVVRDARSKTQTTDTPLNLIYRSGRSRSPSVHSHQILILKVSSCSLVLDIGEDRLVLTARPSLYCLDIFHPFLVDQETSVAQYNSSTQILTITMPVVSS